MKASIHTKTWPWMFRTALFVMVKNWKQMVFHKWVGKQIGLHPYNRILSNKNKRPLTQVVWMSLKIIMRSERSKTKRINVVWLHSYKIPEISNYSTGRRKQIHACLGINGGGGGQVGGIITRTRKCLGGEDMFSILCYWFHGCILISKVIK